MSNRASPDLVWIAWALGACVVVLALVRDDARGEWKPEYAQAQPEVRDWYRNAELTPEAQQRFPFKKCCDHADVVKTRFEVNKTDGRDEWFYEDTPGHMKRIPDDVIHWGESAPDGQPTLFVFGGNETCFFPGDGGI